MEINTRYLICRYLEQFNPTSEIDLSSGYEVIKWKDENEQEHEFTIYEDYLSYKHPFDKFGTQIRTTQDFWNALHYR